MNLTDILRCPQTGSKLRFDEGGSIVRVENSDVTYPVVDGIIDFCPQPDRISAAYDKIAHRYDAYITSSTLFIKICNTLIWGIGDDQEYADTVLSYLPPQFDGVLLDVPVGTAVFTAPAYAKFPNVTIIAVDSSMGMLQQAKNRFEQQGLNNICLLKADVFNLPLKDAVADIVLSMNGLHVFPDKQRAIVQMKRVLRKHGTLVGCCYVAGVTRRADWFVRHFGVRHGYFNPPLFRIDTVASHLEGFTVTRQGNLKSLAYFEAVNDPPNTQRS